MFIITSRPVSDHINELNRETQILTFYVCSQYVVYVFNTCFYTLSFPCPCLAIASYFIFPSASTCTARALDVFFFLPISRGNWATWISGKAPPSPKSCKHKLQSQDGEKCRDVVMDLYYSTLCLYCNPSMEHCSRNIPNRHQTN